MCGICGKLFLDKSKFVDKIELKKMTDSLFHRGPDDEGFYLNKNIGLGFRRLSIIDLKTGHQPLSNENESIWIIFNGEIYNYVDLKDLLIKKGHKFKTNTDTEAIIHLYEEYAEDCVKHLRGMFAFAIWDENKNELFCARDRFGIKPFFYYKDNSKFIFGSEIKSILQDRSIDKTLDYIALDSYFAYSYINGERSIFKKIRKLEPGCTLTLKLKNKLEPIISKYWDVNFDPDYSKSENEWSDELESIFSESVKMHMISDVPLGAFLSGGIDSSSVVAMMSRLSNLPVKTFSIGFKEKEFNELEYAREIANKYKTEHHEKIIEPESVSILPILVQAYDEPFADSSAIPTYYISKFAREYVTVALSGDGGDEIFAGYNTYLRANNFYRYNITPYGFNKLFWGSISSIIPKKAAGERFTYILSKDRKTAFAYFTQWRIPERNKLYKKEIKKNIDYQYAEKSNVDIIHRSNNKEFLSRLQELDIKTKLVNDMLTKVDRVSMLNSLEVRVPLLDHKIAELVFKIPAHLRLKNKSLKYIFRKTMSKYLPESVLMHKKQGFALPLELWFKKDLKEYVNDKLNSNNKNLSELFNMHYVQKIANAHNKGIRSFTTHLWSLLFFDAWIEQNK